MPTEQTVFQTETRNNTTLDNSFLTEKHVLTKNSVEIMQTMIEKNTSCEMEGVNDSCIGSQNSEKHNELCNNCSDDNIMYEGVDESSSENESEFDDNDQDILDDSEIFTANEESFNKDKRIMFSASNFTVSDVVLMLKAITIKYGMPREQTIDLIDFIKCLAGPQFSTWSFSPYKLDKFVAPPEDNAEKLYFCEECCQTLIELSVSKKQKAISTQCCSCKKKFTITSISENYFIYFDIKYQLQMLLNDKNIQQSMFDFIKETCISKDNVINDITDSELYKKHVYTSNTISFNFSLDGAQQWKSAKKSLWPMQIHLNCFSGETRFNNTIIVGLYQAEKEPTPKFMNLFLSVLKKQCDVLIQEGIQLTDYWTKQIFTLKLVPFCACVDRVAMPLLQNRIQFNGYFGCSCCYHHGFYYKNAMKFPIEKDDPELRTHERHINHVSEVLSSGRPTEFGVKGYSILLDFPNFDIVWNLPPDYMHQTLLGVSKQLTRFERNFIISRSSKSKKKNGKYEVNS